MLLGQIQLANAVPCLQKEPKADVQGRIQEWGKHTEKLQELRFKFPKFAVPRLPKPK